MNSVMVLEVFIAAGIVLLLWCLWNFHQASKTDVQRVGMRFELRSEPEKDNLIEFPQLEKPVASIGNRTKQYRAIVFLLTAMLVPPLQGQEQSATQTGGDLTRNEQDDPVATSSQPPATPPWQYGGFLDAAYLWDPDHPANQLFRSRGTAYQVNKPMINMAGVYAKKPVSEASRWGLEATVHVGQDSRIFGFSATAPNLPGSKWLRHLGPTNVSYLAPVGKGLTVQGGIFSSFIGYDSLYAQDNFNYTRPWGADFTPYLMMGINASHPFSNKATGTLFLVNGYWHLADANHVPSSGGQFAYKASDRWTLKNTVLYGPHQSDTSLEFWRFLYDSIAEWKSEKTTLAFEYHVGSERIAGLADSRALWMAAQLPIRRVLSDRWTFAIRPEVYWDRDGRVTTFQQTVKALTTTIEYRIPFWQTNTKLRVEHRIDDSRGPQGGFFKNGEISPGVPRLTPTQNLVVFGLLWNLDATSETKWR